MVTIRFTDAQGFHFSDPMGGVEKWELLVDVDGVPPDVPIDPMTRPTQESLQGPVYGDIERTLRRRPGMFHLVNRGLILTAQDVSQKDSHTFDVLVLEGHGIVDGGHTYTAIRKAVEEDRLCRPQKVSVRVLIVPVTTRAADFARPLFWDRQRRAGDG